MDYPQPDQQHAATELHLTVESNVSVNSQNTFEILSRDGLEVSADPIYKAAQSIVKSLDQGFSLHSLYELFKRSYDFVLTQQGLSLAEQKLSLTALINHIVDITDTPYLPDSLTDPIFKSLAPSLLDLYLNFQEPDAVLIPEISLEKPSPESFQAFINTLKETYSDGFELSDIAVYIKKSTEFIMGFSDLTKEEKMQSTCDIVNMIVDNINFGPLPSSITSPILKSFTKPLIEAIFSKL